MNSCSQLRSLPVGIFALALVATFGLAAGSDADDTSAETEAAALAPLVQILEQIDQPLVQLDILRGLHEAIAGRRSVAMPAGWSRVYQRLAVSPNAEVRGRARELAVIFGDPRALESLRKSLGDTEAEPAVRREALQALVQRKDPALIPTLLKLLDDGGLREAALLGLATFEDSRIAPEILKRYSACTADEKRAAISTLAARPASALLLLDAVAAGTVPRNDLSTFIVRQLAAFNDTRVYARVKEVWGTVRETDEQKAALIARYRARLNAKALKQARPEHGRAVFAKNCATCHQLFDAGRKLGPNLTGAQRNNLDYVLENVIDPNAVVSRDYRVTTLVTTEGRVINGVVVAENNSVLTVQTANDRITIPKAELEIRQQSRLSMMPEGLFEKLTDEQIRDLVAYLASPTQVPLPEELSQ